MRCEGYSSLFMRFSLFVHDLAVYLNYHHSFPILHIVGISMGKRGASSSWNPALVNYTNDTCAVLDMILLPETSQQWLEWKWTIFQGFLSTRDQRLSHMQPVTSHTLRVQERRNSQRVTLWAQTQWKTAVLVGGRAAVRALTEPTVTRGRPSWEGTGERARLTELLCPCSRPGRLTSWAGRAVNKTHAGLRCPREPSQHKVKHSYTPAHTSLTNAQSGSYRKCLCLMVKFYVAAFPRWFPASEHSVIRVTIVTNVLLRRRRHFIFKAHFLPDSIHCASQLNNKERYYQI